MKLKNFSIAILLTVVFLVVLDIVFMYFDSTHEYDGSNFMLGWWSAIFYLSVKDYIDEKNHKTK